MDVTALAQEKKKWLLFQKEEARKAVQNGEAQKALSILRIAFLKDLDILDEMAGDSREDLAFMIETEETGRFSPDGVPAENLLLQLEDTMTHKIHVVDSCAKMIRHLLAQSEEQKALALLRRAFVHDISKLSEDEFFGLARFANDVEAMTNKNVQKPSSDKIFAIELHWKRNSHHPEFHQSVLDMSELDEIEMCCDWHSRSVQFGTNLLEWVEEKLQARFQFPPDMYRRIHDNCSILVSSR